MSTQRLRHQRWTRQSIIAAISADSRDSLPLNYSAVERRNPSLVHAAEREFGHWSTAVEAAGIEYRTVSRYRRWTTERVIGRLRELHADGEDLSWRHVSTVLDPALAAAALHAGRFASWAEALDAAGIPAEDVMRYRRWTVERIQEELLRLILDDASLDQASLAREAPALLAAIYRVGGGLATQLRLLERKLLARRAQLKRVVGELIAV
jgi:hypothetical protein